MSTVKVLQLCSSGEFGGKELVIKTIAAGVDPERIRMKIAVFEKGPLADELTDQGLDCSVLGVNSKISGKLLKKIKIVISSFKPDVIHVHEYKDHFYGWLALPKRNSPAFFLEVTSVSSISGWASSSRRSSPPTYPEPPITPIRIL